MCSAADWQKQGGDNLRYSSSWGRSLLASSTPWRPALSYWNLYHCCWAIKAVSNNSWAMWQESLHFRPQLSGIRWISLDQVWNGKRKPAHAFSQEKARDAAKPHPNFPRHWAADNRDQHQHAASWTSIQKRQVWLPHWHGPSLIQFNSVQQWAGTRSNNPPPHPKLQRGKGELKEAKHGGKRKRGSFDEKNNNNLDCITLLRLFKTHANSCIFFNNQGICTGMQNNL